MLLARNPHRYLNSLHRKITPKRTFCTTSGAHVPAWFVKKKHETLPKFSKLDTDTDTEVTVVGGGIAGLTSAYLLTLKGKSVVLVDDGEICSGETGRTTAHLVSGVDDRYFVLEKNFGKEGAKTMADAHKTAIDTIERIVQQEKIDCEFERLDGYLFLSPEHKIDLLKKELKSAFEAGLKVEMVDDIPVDSFSSGPALKFRKQGQFDPLKYCSHLAQAILKNGGKIYTNTHIASMTGNAGAFAERKAEAKTSDGHKIKSSHLIVATNVPVNDRVTMYTKLEPYRSYVITSKVPKGSVPKALYWDSGDPYHYVRLTSYDNESDLLIVGGEDHKVGQAFDFEERYRNLYVWASARWKMMGPIKHRWSGQVIEPTDNVAFIGRNPNDYENVYIVTGDSGNGMTHGTIAGIMFTDMIMGKKNPWEKLFDPSRKPLSEPKEFIQHNINVGTQYKDWVTKSEVDSLSEIPVGSGAILRKGLGKIAVYRDQSGNFCEYSAICPHMAAIVRWNDDEKSWDCPAHGSRFDCKGKVVNGPANCGLSPVEPEPKVNIAGEMGTSPPLFR